MLKINKKLRTICCALFLAFSLIVGYISPAIFGISANNASKSVVAASYSNQSESNYQHKIFTEKDIILDFQGGTKKVDGKDISEETIKVSSNEDLNEDTPTRENYDFYGYFSEPNAKGKKYFNYLGKIENDVDFENNAPKKLYAAWVKTVVVTKTSNSGNIKIDEDSGDVYSPYDLIDLDFEKLKEIGYQKIEVNIEISIRAQDKGVGRDMWFCVYKKSSQSFDKRLMDYADIEYTDWKENYASIVTDINKFDNASQFRFKFAQSKRYFWTDAIWWVKGANLCFSAKEKVLPDAYSVDRQTLNANSYQVEDNSGYNIYGKNPTTNPLGKNYASINLNVKGGSIVKGDVVNGIQQYGYIVGDNFSQNDYNSISFSLKYNYNSTKNINNSGWQISEDTYSGAINGINGVGVVQSGAVIVQKLNVGGNPSNPNDWVWQNPITSGTTQSFHSSNFTSNYSPENYDGNTHSVKFIEPVIMRNSDGSYVYKYEGEGEDRKISGVEYKKDSKGNIIPQDVYKDVDGYVSLYSPNGEDLKNGITLKFLFVYELKYKSGSKWKYTNVVEETIVSLYPSTAKILFQNMDFSNTAEDESFEVDGSGLIRKFGEVLNGHSVNDAFRVNFNGNTTYTVEYFKNNATNLKDKKYAVDGQIFMEPGKYRFVVTPVVGKPRETTIYISKKGINQNIETYFGNEFISSDSHRVYSDTDSIPVYLSGKTFWQTQKYDEFTAPLVGRIGILLNDQTEYYDEVNKSYYIVYNNQKLYRDKDYFKHSFEEQELILKIVTEVDATDRLAHSGVLTEEGYYFCEFANNTDFFANQKNISGDTYYFSFQFMITSETRLPSINENLLNSNISFVDFSALYYGVEIQTKGIGKAIFVFIDFETAHKYAYDYYKTLITESNGTYYFNGNQYSSAFEVFAEVDKISKDSVKTKYLDATNTDSYLTIAGKVDDVLSLNLEKDIIVFDSGITSYYTAIGDPFLNDRPYAYIDETGNIVKGVNKIKFIQIAEYESKSVTLTNIDENISYEIGYGIPVQDYLMSKNASTGKYKITEKNLDSTIEYDAVYIRPGDNRTLLNITRVNNINQTSQLLKQANANIRFENVNAFILNSVSNVYDPYGIVKIINNSTNETVTKQFDEIKDYKIETIGNYQIEVVDRLGNLISYYFDIYEPKKVYSLTLSSDVEGIREFKVGEGTRFNLAVPESPNDLLEFAGWEDELGNVITKSHIYYEYSKNMTLKATWQYKQVKVDLFDGPLIEEYLTKPNQTLKLKDLYNVSKDGLTYFRYVYEDENGQRHFYLPQIQNVPNVQYIKLNTLWQDLSNPIYASYGDSLTAPESKKGYTFYGYVYSKSGTNHYLFTDQMDYVTDGEVELYALYLSNQNNSSGFALAASMAGIIGSLSNFVSTSIATPAGMVGSALALSLIFILAKFIIELKKKKRFAANAYLNYENFVIDKTLSEEIKSFDEITAKETLKNRRIAKKIKLKKSAKHLPKLTYRNFVLPLISCVLILVFGFIFNFNTIYVGKERCEESARASSIERELENYKNELILNKEHEQEEQKKAEEFVANATELYENNSNLGLDLVDEFSDEDLFLFGLVYNQLTGLGYTVFPANAIKENGEAVFGYGYFNINDLEFLENKNSASNKVYLSAGFVALSGGTISQEDAEDGISIIPTKAEAEFLNEFEFVLGFEEKLVKTQYIAFENYVAYSVSDFQINILLKKHVGNGYLIPEDEEVYSMVKLLGYLYNYDIKTVMYDYLNQEYESSAFSTVTGVDYDISYASYINTIIKPQDENFMQLESVTINALSVESINEYVLSGQDETFLGISAEQIYFIESQLEDTIFYYVNAETGSIEAIDSQTILKMYKDAANAEKSSTFWTIFSYVLNGLMIVGGIILCCTGIGAGIGGSLIVGGAIGILAEIYKDEVTGFLLDVLGKDGSQVLGSGVSMTMGGLTINVGRQLWSKGPWGMAAGALLMLLGAVVIGFGAAELGEVIFDYNFIKELFNLSDLAYSNIYKGLSYAATITVIVYGTLKSYYKALNRHNQLKALAEAGGISIKELRRMSAEELNKYIDKVRSTAVTEAKAQELNFLKLQKAYYESLGMELPNEGWGSLGNLTKEQALEIIRTGKFTITLDGVKYQFDGHHIYSVDLSKETGKYAKIVDPNNIAIGERNAVHFQIWHSGKWATQTQFVYDAFGNTVYNVNRTAMIESLKNLMKGIK